MILLNDYYYFRVLARFVRLLIFRIMHTENTNEGLLTYSIYFTSVVPTQYAADSEIDFSNENNVSKLTVAYCSFTILE